MEEIWDKNQNDKRMRFHYENMPMQDNVIANGCKDNNFQVKICVDFSCFCLKHRLWLYARTASIKYTQSMFYMQK